jgi:hypothetical protein
MLAISYVVPGTGCVDFYILGETNQQVLSNECDRPLTASQAGMRSVVLVYKDSTQSAAVVLSIKTYAAN